MVASSHSRIFDPVDLAVLERVYQAAWARIEANGLDRDRAQDDERKEAVRKWVFAFADRRPVDFDVLMQKLDGVSTSLLLTVSKTRSLP